MKDMIRTGIAALAFALLIFTQACSTTGLDSNAAGPSQPSSRPNAGLDQGIGSGGQGETSLVTEFLRKSRRIRPLPNAHAHNDYEHERPLWDALFQGFCSVEADVHLVDGQLLVAHDLEDADPKRTLQSLYLDPLRSIAHANQGFVYKPDLSLLLLIDIKSEAEATYARLDEVLREYESILTSNHDAIWTSSAVTVVISGNRPKAAMLAQDRRLAFYDGRFGDLEVGLPNSFMPLVSENWNNHFRWKGEGLMPEEEREKLNSLAGKMHERGHRLRFWATPETEAAWKALANAKADYINTDRLEALKQYLTR